MKKQTVVGIIIGAALGTAAIAGYFIDSYKIGKKSDNLMKNSDSFTEYKENLEKDNYLQAMFDEKEMEEVLDAAEDYYDSLKEFNV
jgi:hypothetical protein